MNRFVLGASLLLLSPFAAGCQNFYVLEGPAPAPVPTPLPPTPEYPIAPAEGLTPKVTSPSPNGIALNGVAPLPTSFRAADVRYVPKDPRDPANCVPLLVLQGVTNDANGNPRLETADVSNPVRLAGIIVPGPAGQASAGLQDADLQAMQNVAFTESLKAMKNWAQGRSIVLGTPTPTPTAATSSATVRVTPPTTQIASPSRELDVYQDPRYIIDSDNRRVVQVLFNSVEGVKVKPDPKSTETLVIVPPNTKLSLNRMMLRSGWAVVDLYSSTSFDQETWLLDEAYARHRRLGMWGLQLNGKKLSLQQRVPVLSTGTGVRSSVKVTTGNPRTGGVTPSATQVPSNITPKLASPAYPKTFKSGTNVRRGPATSFTAPTPASNAAAVSTAPISGAVPGASPGPSAPPSGG